MEQKTEYEEIKVGDTVGHIEILDKEYIKIKSEKKVLKYICRCNKCGYVFIATKHEILYRHSIRGCPNCRKKARFEKKCKDAENYIGKEYGTLKVIDIDYVATREKGCLYMRCICNKCGNETTILLKRLKGGGAKQCANCAKKILSKGREIGLQNKVEGTCIIAIDGRRSLNKNNTSNHVGVSFINKLGKWRAYITFKRKQYHLGLYTDYSKAVVAREEAEEKIYGGFLEWYKNTYPEHWEKIKKNN